MASGSAFRYGPDPVVEALFILLSGGVMLAVSVVPHAGAMRTAWLRLGGIVATMASAVGAALALVRGDLVPTPPFYRRTQAALVGLTVFLAIAHLALNWARTSGAARALGIVGFVVAVLAGSNLLHDAMLTRGTAVAFPPKGFSMALQTLSAAGAGAVTGFALMTALFPACGIPARPDTDGAVAGAFLRLYRGLFVVLALRAALAVAGVLVLHAARPVPGLWDRLGPLVALRWIVGLVAVALLAALARRRMAAGATLSAAAFLLVAALLAVDAEALALHLVRGTGLPF